jgi:hypothetical protein
MRPRSRRQLEAWQRELTERGRVDVRHSATRLVVLAAVSAWFVVAGAWLAMVPGEGMVPQGAQWVVGVLTVPLGLLGLGAVAKRATGEGRVAAILDREGLTVTATQQRVPWTDVRGAVLRQYGATGDGDVHVRVVGRVPPSRGKAGRLEQASRRHLQRRYPGELRLRLGAQRRGVQLLVLWARDRALAER